MTGAVMNPQEFRRNVLEKKAGATGKKERLPPAMEARNAIFSLLGAGLGWYCGMAFLVPFLLSAAVAWLGYKVLRGERKSVLLALSIQGGQFLWMLGGALLQHLVAAFSLDLVWLLGGLIWLVASPRLLPVCLLAIYQLLSLVRNGMMLMHAQIGTLVHKGLLVHLVWQVAALVSLIVLFMQLRAHARGMSPNGGKGVGSNFP